MLLVLTIHDLLWVIGCISQQIYRGTVEFQNDWRLVMRRIVLNSLRARATTSS